MKKHIKIYAGILLAILFSMPVKAQNSGPNAPEAMAFEPVDATDMVNLLTGDFSYVLPLVEVPSPEGSYPLALSYHAGIPSDFEASWVGLGWTLNPGAINRSVNGYPDDMLAGLFESVTHVDEQTHTVSYFNVTVPLPGVTIGLGYTWGDYQAFNGSVGIPGASINFTIDGSGLAGFGVGFGMEGIGNMSISMNREGTVGLSASSYGVSASISTDGQADLGFSPAGFASAVGSKGEERTKGLGERFKKAKDDYSFGESVMGSALGVTFSTKGVSSSISIAGSSISGADVGSKGDFQYSETGFDVNLVLVRFGKKTRKTWMHKVSEDFGYGALYSKDAAIDLNIRDGFTVQHMDHMMDIVTTSFYSKDPDIYEQGNNPAFTGYDHYSVAGQGIGGSISPRIHQPHVIAGHYSDDRNDGGRILSYKNSIKNMNKVNVDAENIYFYFTRMNESYLKTYTPSFYFHPITGPNSTFGMDSTHNGIDFYKGEINRMHASNHIEWFTNQEIADGLGNPAIEQSLKVRGFMETRNFYSYYGTHKRADTNLFDPTGIGAYAITTPDGKTYHYSLPVYNFEEFLVKNIDDKTYFEYRKHGKYAVSWLLTSITGPDYYDKNQNGLVDQGDYGYWITFNYGKWADGFVWQKPFNFNVTTKGTYSWGRKQVYYLNSIETRSHTAYFVKSLRKDGLSRDKERAETTHTAWSNKTVAKELLTHLAPIPNCDYVTETKTHTTAYDIPQVQSLKLDKIIIVNNKDFSPIRLFHNSTTLANQVTGSMTLLTTRDYHKVSLNPFPESSYWRPHNTDHSKNFYSQYQNNVLDVNDVALEELQKNALKTIELIYNENTPIGSADNSNYTNKGQLTLSGVKVLSNSGFRVMPPYKFNYHTAGKIYEDAWGFDWQNPVKNSLKEIITPLGGKIEIEYESDRYTSQAVTPELEVYDFELSDESHAVMGGARPGVFLYCEYRVKDDQLKNVENNNISFTDLYIKGTIGWSFGNSPSCGDQHTFNEWQKVPVTTKPDGRTISFTLEFDNNSTGCVDPGEVQSGLQFRVVKPEIVGGGLRVSRIKLSGNDGKSYHTAYYYTNPETGNESGTTSFSPGDNQVIPYMTFLPAPGVYYEYVTVRDERIVDGITEFNTEKVYQFNVIKPTTNQNLEQFSTGCGTIEVEDLYPDYKTKMGTIGQTDCFARSAIISDRSANLGQIHSVTEKNEAGDVMSKTTYSYNNTKDENSIGVYKETVFNIKNSYNGSNPSYTRYTATSKIEYASELEKVTTEANGIRVTTFSEDYSPYTGVALTTRQTSSVSEMEALSRMVSAYEVEPLMGFKFNDLNNKNMVGQTVATISSERKIDDPTLTEHVKAVSVETWNNNWTYRDWVDAANGFKTGQPDPVANNFRKHKTFVWTGSLDDDGYLESSEIAPYDTPEDIITNWSHFSGDGVSHWKKSSEITQYDHFSAVEEVTDINNDFAATKKDMYSELVQATGANTNYSSFTATSFEHKEVLQNGSTNYANHFGGEVIDISRTATIEDNALEAHTGEYYLRVPQGTHVQFGIKNGNGLMRDTDYRASVWMHKNGSAYGKLYVTIDGVATEANVSHASGMFGDWYLINHDFTVGPTANEVKVELAAEGGEAFFDDFRVSPYESAVLSYTYNETGNVTAIINNNNYATKYYYDYAGRLNKVEKETPKGFEKTVEHRYDDTYTPSFNFRKVRSVNATMELEWNSDGNVETFELLRYNSTSGTYSSISSGAGSSFMEFTDTDLQYNTSYGYRLIATYPHGMTYIEDISATTGPEPPVLSVVSKTHDSVTLSWPRSTGFTYVGAYRESSSGGLLSPLKMNPPEPFTVESLSGNTEYEITISGSNEHGGASSTIYVRTLNIPPSPTYTSTENSVVLNWNYTSGSTQYKVYQSNSSGAILSLLSQSTSRTYSATSLSSNTNYYYKIGSVGAEGESISELVVAKTKLATPALRVRSVASSSVTMEWDAVPGATSYKLSRRTTDGVYAVIATLDATTLIYPDYPLLSSVRYYYQLEALSADNNSISGEVSAVTSTPCPVDYCGDGPPGIGYHPASNYANKKYKDLSTGQCYISTEECNGPGMYWWIEIGCSSSTVYCP